MKPLSFTNAWLFFYPISGGMVTLGWLRCCLSFSLLHSAIACICGAWSSSGHFDRTPPPMDLVRVESCLMN